MMNTRVAAVSILFEVVHDGVSLSNVLPKYIKNFSDKRDQAFIQALCYGVCRWYFRLDALARLLLEKPLKDKDCDVYLLILMGLYQLIDMRIPDYAAVGETVAATKALKKIWAKNLVNGVLRQYQRRADELTAIARNNPVALYAHPKWMIDQVKQAWPDDWDNMLNENNEHPPMVLRVNQRLHSRESYLKLHPELKGRPIRATQSAIILDNPCDVSLLPGFNEGEISVQDAAAQLAAELLMLEPKQRVLDACAAPGGKTAHILELQANLDELIALDHDEDRLALVTENLQRLHLSASSICADAGELKSWWDGKLFDRILLDAPCSASGVIRRHPDIKLLRRESDMMALANEQERLLLALWQTLKPGGVLLYATCSIFPEENTRIIQDFLETHREAKEEKIVADWGKTCQVGRQILTGMHSMDGFYYARLRKW